MAPTTLATLPPELVESVSKHGKLVVDWLPVASAAICAWSSVANSLMFAVTPQDLKSLRLVSREISSNVLRHFSRIFFSQQSLYLNSQ